MLQHKYGFVYIWYDRKHKRYYIGCHWGTTNDGYICSSPWMIQAYRIRPNDFKRKILKNNISSRPDLYEEEQRWLNYIKPTEIKPINPNPRYYNLHITNNNTWHKYPEHIKSVGAKISAKKKGKLTGSRDPSVGKAISEAKRQKRLEREAAGLPAYTVSGKVRAANLAKTGRTHSVEQKKKISDGMKRYLIENPPKKVETIPRMSLEEQSKLCSEQLTSRWADPVWKENQKNALKQSWSKRRQKLNNNELTR
jgi:hypothetical protein